MNETKSVNDIDEPRLFEEDGIEGRVAALISPLLKPLSYRLIRVKLSSLNGLTLQIMAERTDGTMTIEDCEMISRTVSPFLDVQNIIERKYHLEISSPGIDRLLVRKSDFFKWQGHIAKIETGVVINGRQKFRGTLTNITQNSFTLNVDKASHKEITDVLIPFADVTNARLVLTDELIRDALKKDKDLRQQLTPEDNLNTLTAKTNCQN
nr:ribosome maturation factor RimP [Bartonella bovis]